MTIIFLPSVFVHCQRMKNMIYVKRVSKFNEQRMKSFLPIVQLLPLIMSFYLKRPKKIFIANVFSIWLKDVFKVIVSRFSPMDKPVRGKMMMDWGRGRCFSFERTIDLFRKTFTMGSGVEYTDPAKDGILPRAIMHIFQRCANLEKESASKCLVSCQFIEVTNLFSRSSLVSNDPFRSTMRIFTIYSTRKTSIFVSRKIKTNTWSSRIATAKSLWRISLLDLFKVLRKWETTTTKHRWATLRFRHWNV